MRKGRGNSRGFTLIDVAVAMIVIGLLAVPALKYYNVSVANKKQNTTLSSLFFVNKAIEEFFIENDYYPCPANITLNENDNDYGEEICNLVAGARVVPAGIPLCAVSGVPPNPARGVCFDGGGTVLKGGVPFADLKIPIDQTIDSWGNKLTYAVTVAQTDFWGAAPPPGVIRVDGYDQTWVGVNTTYTNQGHYIVVSHGERGIGSYTAKGRRNLLCNSAAVATVEEENCDNDTTYVSYREPMPVPAGETCDDPANVGGFIPCFVKAHSLTDNAGYYDDYTVYRDAPPERIWAHVFNAPDPDALFTSDIFTSADFVGIGTVSPQYNLDVVGNIKSDPSFAFDGDAWAEWICASQDIAAAGDDIFDANCVNIPNAVGGELVFEEFPVGSGECRPVGYDCYPAAMIGGPAGNPDVKPTSCGGKGAMNRVARKNPDGVLGNADDEEPIDPMNWDADLCGAVIGVPSDQKCPYAGRMIGVDEAGNIICEYNHECPIGLCPVGMGQAVDNATQPPIICGPCQNIVGSQ
jgi:Tfp pilus assembly protein PilE